MCDGAAYVNMTRRRSTGIGGPEVDGYDEGVGRESWWVGSAGDGGGRLHGLACLGVGTSRCGCGGSRWRFLSWFLL